MSITTKDLLITDEQKQEMRDREEILDRIYSAFVNDGLIVNANDDMAARVTISDLLTLEDVERFVPQVVIRILHEAREPHLVISQLFDKIRLERGQTIQIGAIGAITIHELPEGGEYKPSDIQMDSGDMVGLSVRKYGCLLQFTEEMIEDSQWDVIGLWMRAAGRAFARNREKRASQLLAVQGEVVFDNADATNAFYGVTTGRNIAGTQNGSMTANDIFDMFAFLSLRGFNPDTILMHPLAWSMFATDPELREIVMQGSRLMSRKLPTGLPDPGWPTTLGGLGARTKATGQGLGSKPDTSLSSAYQKIGSIAHTAQLSALGATFQSAPGFLGMPISVLVTPFLPFANGVTATGNSASVATTTVVVVDSSMVGAFIEKTGLSSEEFRDPMRDVRNMKLRERFGLVLYEQGKGLAIAKNIVLAKNYVFENTNTATLSALAPRTNLIS